ncbi:MAG: hypothetical protein PHX18_07885 [Candidatus Gastranaerophilales bacterium]|nr:hypothetical protein [Candidatus Gastranaerophilales bacterium]
MNKKWKKAPLPRVAHVCCGYKYDTKDAHTINYFRCFAHKPLKKEVENRLGEGIKIDFCITFWLSCKNNDCIKSFTFYYDRKSNLVKKEEFKGIEYIMKIKDFFIENIEIKVKEPLTPGNSKKYLWLYTDGSPTKKFVSNIYNLDDKKVGETGVQEVRSYKL